MRKRSLLPLLLITSCTIHRAGIFRVVPGDPEYLLHSPDGHEASFTETLRHFNGFERGHSTGMALLPKMELNVENAYYQEGKPKRGLDGYLGTEIAHFRLEPDGAIKLLSVKPMSDRPSDQPPVQELLPASRRHYRYNRFYFEVFFKKSASSRGSVILGASSQNELNNLAALLATDPDSVCDSKSAHCTVFPEACSVSVEMEIFVNGTSQTVVWGSGLNTVVTEPRQITMRRSHLGKLTPLQVDLHDPNALKLPLLPGDRVDWK